MQRRESLADDAGGSTRCHAASFMMFVDAVGATLRHWFCCQDDGDVGLCGVDLSGVAQAPADESVKVMAEVVPCIVCIEMQAETPVGLCARYGRRCD